MFLLREGSVRPEVKILQGALLAAGFDPMGDDGVFGAAKAAALALFGSLPTIVWNLVAGGIWAGVILLVLRVFDPIHVP